MKDKDCIFCLLANGDIPTAKVYEDEDVTVILDAGPASKGHALVLPKDHYKNITEVPQDIAGKMISVAAKVGQAQMKALGADGFNVVINTNEAAGQTVFHCHVHIIPRYIGDHMVEWVPKQADQEENAKIAKELAKEL